VALRQEYKKAGLNKLNMPTLEG